MIITVPKVGTGKGGDPHRPHLPEGDSWSLVEDHGDTMTVRISTDDPQAVERWAVENGYLVPVSITPRQARLVLLSFGLLDQIEGAIAAIEDPAQRRAAEIEWEFASSVSRDHPLVQAFANQLGWSSEQVDQLMIQGYLIGG